MHLSKQKYKKKFLTAVLAAIMLCAAPTSVMAAEDAGEQEIQTEEASEDLAESESRDTAGEEAAAETENTEAQQSDLSVMLDETLKLHMQTAVQAAATQTNSEADNVRTRRDVVNYALSFVGNPYVAGGQDPHSGADCSGFVRYVLRHAAGVNIAQSSVTQAAQGRSINADQMQPGDLIFYGEGSHINHVAMYIGNGRVVHASTEATGIKTSPWDYRSPLKIVSMLG